MTPGWGWAPARLSRTDVLVALALGAGFTLLYLATRSAWHMPDALAYARLVRDSALDSPGFARPEHLLHPLLPWLLHQALQATVLPRADAAATLQAVNAFAGGAGIAVVFALGRTLPVPGTSRGWAILAAVTTGLAYGYWLHSTQAENQILAVFPGLLALWCVLPAGRSPLTILAGGVLLGLAVAVHATVVLLAIPFGLALLLQRRWLLAASGLALGAAVSLAVLALVAMGPGFTPAGGRTAGWLLSAGGLGVWGQFSLGSLPQALRTLVEAFVYTGPGFNLALLRSQPGNLENLARILATLIVLGTLLGTVLHVLARFRPLPAFRPSLVLLAWAGAVLAFATWWAPDDVQFFVAAIPALALLLGAAGAQGSTVLPLYARLSPAILGTFVAVMGLANLLVVFLPQTNENTNVDAVAARCLATVTLPGDLVVSPGWGWAGTWYPWVGDGTALSVTDVYLSDAGRDQARTRELVQAQVQSTLAAGGRVWFVQFDEGTDEEQAFYRRVTGGLGPAELGLDGPVTGVCAGSPLRRVQP